jgi:hypothetical protein
MSALTTTFKELHEWDACRPGYRKLAKGLGGIRAYGRTTPIQVSKVLDICGIDDCFWVIERAALNEDYERELRLLRLLACDYAERVLSIFESEYPGDHRPRRAIETARRYATGDASKEELASASAAEEDAAKAATRTAAWAAVWAAIWAARAWAWASGAAKAATWAAGSADERTAQTQMLRDVLVKLEAEEPKA